MVYIYSEETYQELYKRLEEFTNSSFMEYFNKNWDPIRTEWTAFNMIECKLANFTNNRLESINKHTIKVVDKKSSLTAQAVLKSQIVANANFAKLPIYHVNIYFL